MKLILLSLLAVEQTAARLTAHLHLEKPRRIMVKPQLAPACDASCPDGDGVGNTGEPCCVAPTQCVDGTCDTDETDANCPQDCQNPFCVCGDGICNADETCTSCPLDCKCTSPNCPPEATSCLCPDRATSCSNDQDCPVKTSTNPGRCSGGLRSGLPCTNDVLCPTEHGYTDCVGVESVVSLPAEGSCRACSGVLQHSGLIIGDINQCGEGDLCGDYTNSTNPVTCVSCLSPMTCEDWCKIDNNLGQYEGQFLESSPPGPAVLEEASTLVPVQYLLSCQTRGKSHQTRMLERSVMLTISGRAIIVVKIGVPMSSHMIRIVNR
mmetsp:Transcript_15113/g.24681  ORF Transcript_15113/g.24681 Transcript_15113/m.24681 type:complete len:322 (+) Transcript_15113:360-1325(+)